MSRVNLRHRLFCHLFDGVGWLKVHEMGDASLPRHRKPFSPAWASSPLSTPFRGHLLRG